jgi:glyoxylase-like metal-dependent hydrolase (beta-lactamase superfamily II)
MADFRLTIIPVTEFQQNCTLLFDRESHQAVVFDPGGEVDRILDAITREGLSVGRILLTHGHLDHAGGADQLRQRLNEGRPPGAPRVEIWGPHEGDRFLLDGIDEQQKVFGLSGLASVTPDRWLAEGDVVPFGPLSFDVLHCPGHSPGSVVYVEQTARFALVGDVLFRGSVGRTDFPYGDEAALMGAIRTKLLVLGDDIRFICGHGPASSFGEERQGNPYLR